MQTSESNGHTLVFEEKPYHRYLLDGVKVNSVSAISKGGLPTSPRLIRWMVGVAVDASLELCKLFPEQVGRLPDYVLEEIAQVSKAHSRKKAQEAADIGTILHEYAELYEKGAVPNELMEMISVHKDKDKILCCIDKFTEWKKQNNDTILKHEEICASVTFGIAGKFDRLAKRRNSVVLSDWKTSSGIYIDQLIQLSLYALLVEEWFHIKVDAIEIVRFGKENGEFEVKLISDPTQLADLKQQAIRNIGTCAFLKRWEN